MGYERLEKSLIDLVKEEQAKLGYRKEMIRLYYPLSSLNHFMETNADSEEMQELLAAFPKAAEDIFGEVGITHAKDRFCFALSEKASEYVHENMKPNGSKPGFVVYYTNYSMMIDSDITGIQEVQ